MRGGGGGGGGRGKGERRRSERVEGRSVMGKYISGFPIPLAKIANG